MSGSADGGRPSLRAGDEECSQSTAVVSARQASQAQVQLMQSLTASERAIDVRPGGCGCVHYALRDKPHVRARMFPVSQATAMGMIGSSRSPFGSARDMRYYNATKCGDLKSSTTNIEKEL